MTLLKIRKSARVAFTTDTENFLCHNNLILCSQSSTRISNSKQKQKNACF